MTGNSLIDKIILGLSFLAGCLVIGLFVFTNYLYTKPDINEKEQLAKLKSDTRGSTMSETYKINRLIVNLYADSTRLRFLEITPHFVPFNKGFLDLLTKNESIVSDVVINVAGKMSPEELNTVSGKILLEARIKNELNERLGVQAIKDIYFANFVVQ
jgi:flagellar FliL protein